MLNTSVLAFGLNEEPAIKTDNNSLHKCANYLSVLICAALSEDFTQYFDTAAVHTPGSDIFGGSILGGCV